MVFWNGWLLPVQCRRARLGNMVKPERRDEPQESHFVLGK